VQPHEQAPDKRAYPLDHWVTFMVKIKEKQGEAVDKW
jgi:hypothetical protein